MPTTIEKLNAGVVSEKRFPLLETGYHLSADEFHARYAQAPENVRAELIEGIVYMASPVYTSHSDQHFLITTLCGAYEFETPGVIGGIGGSVRLDGKNEYQPDLHLRIATESGGRTTNPEKKMVIGGPEFVVEISNTTLEMDLHEKFEVYQRDGVLEYLIWEIEDQKIKIFELRKGRFELVEPDAKGVFKSKRMLGLWLNVPAILAINKRAAMHTLHQGLKSPEHAGFVKRLQGGGK